MLIAIASGNKEEQVLDSLDILGDCCVKIADYEMAIRCYGELLERGKKHYEKKVRKLSFI